LVLQQHACLLRGYSIDNPEFDLLQSIIVLEESFDFVETLWPSFDGKTPAEYLKAISTALRVSYLHPLDTLVSPGPRSRGESVGC
jgi:hypothetical protein